MELFAEHISKSYTKGTDVLENITLCLQGATCFCLLGKNGSGKSTLLNILNDTITATSGHLTINGLGYEKHARELKKIIGVVHEKRPLIEDISVKQYLEFLCYLYDLNRSEAMERARNLIDYIFNNDSQEVISKQINTLSMGMKLKLLVVSSLLHKPKILIWDEPFANVDAVSIEKISTIVLEHKKQGNISIIASHQLEHIPKIVSHIGVLKDGGLTTYPITEKTLPEEIINEWKEEGGNISGDILKKDWFL